MPGWTSSPGLRDPADLGCRSRAGGPEAISPLRSDGRGIVPSALSPDPKEDERRPTGDPDGKSKSTGPSTPVDKDPAKSRPAPPPAMGGPETFADLTRRIAEIQRERQGYWQSILKAIAK